MSKASRKLGFEIFAGPNGQGIDLLKTLEGIQARFGDISKNKDLAARFEEAFGARAGTLIAILLQHLDKYKQAVAGLEASQGLVDKGMAVFGEHGSMVWDRVHASMDAIEIVIGGTLLPLVDKFAHLLVERVAPAVMSFTQHHPVLTKMGVTFAAIAASTLLIGGALAIAAAGLTSFVSFGPAMIAFSKAVKLTALATKAWAAAQWLVNGAMAANPIALVIIGAALLAAVAYEVYKHWDAVKLFFKNWGVEVLGFLVSLFAMLPLEIHKHMARSKRQLATLHTPSDDSSSAARRYPKARCIS